jgi:hypothetical protein
VAGVPDDLQEALTEKCTRLIKCSITYSGSRVETLDEAAGPVVDLGHDVPDSAGDILGIEGVSRGCFFERVARSPSLIRTVGLRVLVCRPEDPKGPYDESLLLTIWTTLTLE